MWTISKEFHFSASHRLNGLPGDHQCARLHGHNYILKIELSGHCLDSTGFVIDYGNLDFVKDWVDSVDHKHLNNEFTFNPTSELICKYLWKLFDDALRRNGYHQMVEEMTISLSETRKTWASYFSQRNISGYRVTVND